MMNGNHHTKAYRADHFTPVRIVGDGTVKVESSKFKKTTKKIHHKKQRAWDKKVAKEEE